MFKKLPILLLTLLSFSYLSYSQTTIYSEDFTGQDGKGAIGPSNFVDLSGVSWDIDISSATLTATADYFQVRNGQFQGRDLDTQASWISPIVDITGFTNVQFTIDALENFGVLEANDFILTEYRIDGGAWTTATTNGNIAGDYVDTIISTVGLSGNTIQLRITMTNNGGGERQIIDNVLIEGTSPAAATVNVSPTSVTGLGYVEGDASLTEGTFTVQGFSLTNDIVITAPTNFEISTTSGAGFTNAITLTPVSGDVPLTTIYVKLISGLTVNIYNDDVTVVSTGVATSNVNVDGEVINPITDCSELMISEYHEPSNGNGNNKYIELYNPTNGTIDLSAYRLASYRNGETLPVIANLTGTINSYSTFLISRTGAAITGDFENGGQVMNFTGNDVMALQTISGQNIDVVGFIGDASNFARNTVLRRNQDVLIPTVAYDTSQWTTAPVDDATNLGMHVSDCSCPNSTTWDGTMWNPAPPNSSTTAILDGVYTVNATNPSFTACSLIINTGGRLRVTNGFSVEVINDVIINDDGDSNTNEIIVETQGTFVQRGDGSLAGTFTLNTNADAVVNKRTSNLFNWYDVTYWSSPVVNETTDGALFDSSRVFWYDANNYINDDDQNAWTREQGDYPMTPGQGFAGSHNEIGFTMPNTAYTYIFSGAYNTGDVTYPIFNDPSNTLHWNLIGNPYPSAIDADAFFTENGSAGSQVIFETIYMWSQVNPVDAGNPGNEVLNYNQNDYITINTVGEAGNGAALYASGTTAAPLRQIPSGQAFFVASTASGNITYKNSMRVSGNDVNDDFYRTATVQNNTASIEKLHINLSSEIGIYSQICISYADIATDGYDGNAIDTNRNYAGNAGLLYSMDNTGEGFYVIQGKAKSSLNEDEIIKIGFGAYISTNETYTIEAIKYEGDYLENNPIYIKDNDLGIVHNLTQNPYTFSSDGGNFDERFEIVFKNQALSIDDNDILSNDLVITEQQDDFVTFEIQNTSTTIKNIKLYDLQGRLIYDLDGNSNSETYNLSNLSQQVYLVKAQLSNGIEISKKSIKK